MAKRSKSLSASKKAEKARSYNSASGTEMDRLQHELQVQRDELETMTKELVLGKERARQVIEASNAAMWEYDLTTGEVYLSEAWADFLGGKRKPTHTTIQALTALVPEEERQMVRDTIIRAIRVGGSSLYQLNHRVKKPDGSFIWVHSRGKVIERDRDGRTLRMIGVNFDITDRIQAETQLMANEQRFRALFESAGDYALVLELKASGPPIIVDGNRSLFKIHGYTRQEVIGHPITMLETAASAKQVGERIERLRKGRVARFEVEHCRKDGSTFTGEAVAKMVEGSGNKLVYGVVQDTTERKQAEQEQQRLLAENRKLLRQLITVQEEERRSLARDLHDELGQLLTSIDARAEYIAKHSDDAELRSVAKEIVRDTKASFNASRATLIGLRPTTLDALGLKAALTELTGNARKKMGIDCVLQIKGKIDQLDDMHAITIYRLVQEALSNAHRHGRADRAEIAIKYTPPHRGRSGQVRIEINDNGKNHINRDMSEGMGIIGMRERIHALNGTFMLKPILHDGMHIEVALPLSDEEDR